MVVKGKGGYKPPPVQTTHYEYTDTRQPHSAAPRIREFRSLKQLPRAEEALQMLRRIGGVVKPLMVKHSWELPLLGEFLPKQDNLLGINYNGGQKIYLRLRYNHTKDVFIDEESVVHTMLHELTHNVRGPHDETFFKFLEKLTEEYYELKRNGFTDFEAFTGQAFKLGGSSRNQPTHPGAAREAAAAQAERRRRYLELGQGGGRLGGSSRSTNGKAPSELAAEVSRART